MANGVYRDGTEGAAAKRQELLQRRRAELVTMPHAVRRVVVARAARVAAGKALAFGGLALAAAAMFPSLAARLASVLPGTAPAPLATVLTATWVMGVVAWAMSGARSQHRFAVAMSRYVLPSDDLNHDVERLDHEHPDERARAMAHGLEVGSAAWPVVAAGAIAPATALWLALLANASGYVSVSQLEDAIAGHGRGLGFFAIAGAFGAIVMTRRWARQPLMAGVLVAVGVVACGMAGYAAVTRMDGAWIYGSVAANLVVAGVVVGRLRRERAQIDIADPAAGSELFTIRGAIRELRAGLSRIGTGLAAARARVGRTSRRTRIVVTAVAAVAAMVVAGGVSFSRITRRDAAPIASVSVAPTPGSIAAPAGPVPETLPPDEPLPARSNAHVETRDGSYWYDIPLDARGTASFPLLGFRRLPPGWEADLDIELIGPAEGGALAVSVGEVSVSVGEDKRATLTFDGCASTREMVIHVVEPIMAGKQRTLRITPHLHLASCPVAANP